MKKESAAPLLSKQKSEGINIATEEYRYEERTTTQKLI
jgi:hypothetical protein